MGSQYFTPGEVDAVCFNCDDCSAGNGDGHWITECSAFLKPKKKEEMESLIARSKLRLLEEM